jgi:hypothetical protein
MKRKIAFIIISCIWALLLAKPVIKFETLEYDFGKIKEEASPHLVDFKFTNIGDEPLKLLDIDAG